LGRSELFLDKVVTNPGAYAPFWGEIETNVTGVQDSRLPCILSGPEGPSIAEIETHLERRGIILHRAAVKTGIDRAEK
jgi:hypothetical protein